MINSRQLVVLTRPAGENEALASRLQENNLNVLSRPLIALSDIGVSAESKQQAIDLEHNDIIIFVSKSAVRFGMPLLDQYWPAWPLSLEWYAVGEGTADALNGFDVSARYPEIAGSEGLLALKGLAEVEGKKILIARGQGGRELLASALGARGGLVRYFETYRRDAVKYDDWVLPRDRTIVVLTSGEIVEHFVDQVGAMFGHVHLIVPSSRIGDKARALGAAKLTITAGASEQALYDAVLNECGILDG
ncbi:MAG: uroporphyrinogen-III synthase [Candidatus Azotimanducaceae bacterium]|jgi:uroporphyrinogen-III synthase